MKNLKFLLSPAYVSVSLIKSKLQIHPVNPANPVIFEIRHEVLINQVLMKFKICPLFTRPIKYK